MTELIEAVARDISIAMFGHDCVPADGDLFCVTGSRLHTVLQAAQAALTAIENAGYRIVKDEPALGSIHNPDVTSLAPGDEK